MLGTVQKIAPSSEATEDFLAYMNGPFKQRNGGWYPKDVDSWLKKNDSAHKRLRSFIGGDRVQAFIKLDGGQGEASGDSFDKIVDGLLKTAPQYLSDYKFTEDVFRSPLITSGSHKVIKLTKHFRNYARDVFCNSRMSDSEILAKTKVVDGLLSDLGAEWAKAKTREREVEVTLSTTPRAFLLLGHYGPDKDSCYRQGSTSPKDKYVLAQTPDTFVLTVSEYDKNVDAYRNRARCWGWFDMWDGKSYGRVNLSNYYFSPKFPEGDFLSTVKILFSAIFQSKKEPLMFENISGILDGGVYHNPYGRWSFAFEDRAKRESCLLHPTMTGIKMFTCPRCGNKFNDDDQFDKVDDQVVCHSCHMMSNVCYITGKKSFSPMEEMVVGDTIVNIHESVIGELVGTCSVTGQNFRMEDLVETSDGEIVCKEVFEDRFVHCDLSDEPIDEKDAVFVDSLVYHKDSLTFENVIRLPTEYLRAIKEIAKLVPDEVLEELENDNDDQDSEDRSD